MVCSLLVHFPSTANANVEWNHVRREWISQASRGGIASRADCRAGHFSNDDLKSDDEWDRGS